MSNELSELQAVDIGLGTFIAAAFSDLNNQTGPKEFREFLGRATGRQIYRHDAGGPSEFIKAYRAAQAAAKTVAGEKTNLVELPLIYYFRKPGLTNGTDKEMTRRGRYSFSEDLKNAYKFTILPLVFDYKLYFLSWDKPTLDKMQLAWYAYAVRNETFACHYKIGADTFEVPAHYLDHKSLLFADESVPPGQDMARVYAVSTGMQISTDVIFGAAVEGTLPDEITIRGGFSSSPSKKYILGEGNGTDTEFAFDSAARLGKAIPITAGSLEIYLGSTLAGSDDGNGSIAGDGLSGLIDYLNGIVSLLFATAPDSGEISISFVENTGSSILVAAGCPTCHVYGCDV